MSKVPVWEQNWGQQSPEIKSKTCPAGADFDPHSGPVTSQGGKVRTLWAEKKKYRYINQWSEQSGFWLKKEESKEK